jgi:flagellar biosynthesis protein FlhB
MFPEMTVNLACFADSQNINKPFHQKPLSDSDDVNHSFSFMLLFCIMFCILLFSETFCETFCEMFHKTFHKTKCKTSKKICEIATRFACFAVLRNSNKPFHQKP